LISSGGLYGAENMALELTRGLRQLGCATSLGVFLNAHRPNLQLAEAARSQGLEVELFQCQGRFDKKTIRRLRDYLSRNNVDILHTHGYKANSYGLSATRGTSARTVATAHNWPGRTLSLHVYGLLDKFQLRFFDRIFESCAVFRLIRGGTQRLFSTIAQTRTCNNGTLSGSYTQQSCSAVCALPWGGTINQGLSVTAYSAASVPIGQVCSSVAQTRTWPVGKAEL